MTAQQITLLRWLSEVYAKKAANARGTGAAETLQAFFQVQHELENWLVYVTGDTGVRGDPLDAPPPLATWSRPAPPLVAEPETEGETRVTWPPEPAFGDYEPEGERDGF